MHTPSLIYMAAVGIVVLILAIDRIKLTKTIKNHEKSIKGNIQKNETLTNKLTMIIGNVGELTSILKNKSKKD